MKNEPVLTAAVAPPLVLTLGYQFWKSMGWPSFTPEQEATFWPFVACLLPIVTGWWARSKVSPN